MSAPERPIPKQENEIPSEELGPDVENLICSFREELSKLPEFQTALAEIYFNPFGNHDVSNGIHFRLGPDHYLVGYDSLGFKPNSVPLYGQIEKFDITVNRENTDAPKRALLDLKKRDKETFGEVDYVTTVEGDNNWQIQHNRKSALEGARGILKEIRDHRLFG